MADDADVSAEIESIQETMKSNFAGYQNNPGMQGRYLELLEARGGVEAPAAVDTEIGEIQERMRSDFSGYQADKEQQARYLELLGKQTAESNKPLAYAERPKHGHYHPPQAAPPAPRAVGAIDTEIAEIQQTMRSDFGAYEGDPAMQARYGELLEAREGAPEEGVVREGWSTPEEVLNAYRDDGRFYSVHALSEGGRDIRETVPALQFAAAEVYRDIGSEEGAQQFQESFDRLPDAVHANVFNALFANSDGERKAPPRDGAPSRDFGETVMAEWGDEAEFRGNVVSARMERIYDGLLDDETKELDHFFLSAPDAEWDAIVRQLSNPSNLRASINEKQGTR